MYKNNVARCVIRGERSEIADVRGRTRAQAILTRTSRAAICTPIVLDVPITVACRYASWPLPLHRSCRTVSRQCKTITSWRLSLERCLFAAQQLRQAPFGEQTLTFNCAQKTTEVQGDQSKGVGRGCSAGCASSVEPAAFFPGLPQWSLRSPKQGKKSNQIRDLRTMPIMIIQLATVLLHSITT